MSLPGAKLCGPEVSSSDEEDEGVPFTFIPVETQIKVENKELSFTEDEVEEEDENLVIRSKRIKTEVNHNKNEDSLIQLMTTGTTSLTPTKPEEHPLLLGMFPHSLLRERLEKDKCRAQRREPDIVCNDCGKCFRFPCDFKRHALMHSGERDFECDTCHKKFKLLSHLKMHIYRFHVGERPFVCKHCGKKYATLTDLKVHVPIHNPERPHVCPTCSKGFITPKDLRKHMQIHTKKREQECDVCKRKFLRRAHLQKHVLVVHKN